MRNSFIHYQAFQQKGKMVTLTSVIKEIGLLFIVTRRRIKDCISWGFLGGKTVFFAINDHYLAQWVFSFFLSWEEAFI